MFKMAAKDDIEYVKRFGDDEIEPFRSKWLKFRVSVVPESIRYDVQKTDSVISPLVAVVEYQLLERAGRLADTRDEAAGKPLGEGSVDKDIKYRNHYHCVDGKWILRKFLRQCTRLDDEWRVCGEQEVAHALMLGGLDVSN